MGGFHCPMLIRPLFRGASVVNALTLGFALFCTLVGQSATARYPTGSPESLKVDQYCGLYSLYSYLRVTGRDVSYQHLCEVAAVSPRGNSLLELRQIADRLGVNLEIRYESTDDFTRVTRSAVIAHLRNGELREGDDSRSVTDGHFVTVLPASLWSNPDEIEAIDGTHGLLDVYSTGRFSGLWTGYYLIEPDSLWARLEWLDRALLLLLLFCSCLAATIFTTARLRRRDATRCTKGIVDKRLATVRKQAETKLAGLALAIAASTVITSPKTVSATETVIETGLWRTPEREFENSLYLWLRLNQAEVTYDQVVNASAILDRPRSFLDLAKSSRHMGVDAYIRRGSLVDLIALGSPTLVYLDGEDGHRGYFAVALLVNANRKVIFVDAARATIESLDADQFQRVWTGHYLIGAQPNQSRSYVIVGTIVVLLYLSTRRIIFRLLSNEAVDQPSSPKAVGVIASLSLCVPFVTGCDRQDSSSNIAGHSLHAVGDRDQPFTLTNRSTSPLHCDPGVVDAILQLSHPLPEGMTASLALHTLKTHGTSQSFDHSQIANGADLLRALINDRVGAETFGSPTLVRTRYGVRAALVPSDLRAAEHHRDQLLAVLGELGYPAATEMIVGEVSFSVRDLIADSLANYHADQAEIGWTAMAYALYLPPRKQWVNKFGETFTFDDLAETVLTRSLHKESCVGSHLVWATLALYRVDREFTPLVSEMMRSRLHRRIQEYVDAAISNQNADGSWGSDWYGVESMPERWLHNVPDPDSFHSKLVATSHIPQWLMAMPSNIDVPDTILHEAGRWLIRVLGAADHPPSPTEHFCPVSHAGSFLQTINAEPSEGYSEPAFRGKSIDGSITKDLR